MGTIHTLASYFDALSPALRVTLLVLGAIVLLLLLRGRLGRALLLGLDRVQQICQVLMHKALHPEQLLDGVRATPSINEERDEDQVDNDEPAHAHHALETQNAESVGSEVFMIIVRLLGLFFTLDVLLALLILDGVRTGLVIFGDGSTAGLIQLPISIPTIMGMLGWSMIVLMGSFLLEVVMKRWPKGLEFLVPFWREGKGSRLLFRFLIGTGTVVLFLYVFLLGLDAQLQLNHIPWPAAGILVAGLQMVEANLTGVFSLWVIVLGLGALFAFGCLLVQLICAILHMLLRAWVKPGSVLVSVSETGGQNTLLPDGGSWSRSEQDGGEIGTEDNPIIVPNAKVAPYQAVVIAVGVSGLRLLEALLDELLHLSGGKVALRLAGHIPTKRPADRTLGENIKRVGAHDIGSSPKVVAIVRQQGGDEVKALLNQVRLRIQQQTPKVTGHELILVAMDAELVPSCVEPLTQLARSLPRAVLVPVVEMPTRMVRQPEMQAILTTLVTLRSQRVIATSVLTDRQQATERFARKTQTAYLAHSLAGLMVAHGKQHHEENPTAAEVFLQLGKAAPFVSLAVGSVALSIGDKLSALDPVRWNRDEKSARGRGNVEETRTSLEALGSQLLTDASARLFPVQVALEHAPLVGEVFIPFPPDQRYKAVYEDMELWSAGTMSSGDLGTLSNLVFIAGPGVPDNTPNAHYFGQWTWWYGFNNEGLPSAAQPVSPSDIAPRQPGDRQQRASRGVRTAASATGATATTGKRARRTPLRAV